jgi:hypothetical protein
MTNWEYRAKHPEANDAFNALMARSTRRTGENLVSMFSFDRDVRIVDVGGGTGSLLAEILKRAPRVHGVLFDQPHVTSEADELLRSAGVRERCEIVAGSFLERIPEGGDVYILSRILHDWSDERCREILTTCRRAMGRTSRLLILEALLPNDGRPSPAHFLDLWMLLVNEGGRERTEGEFQSLLTQAGLRLERVRPAGEFIFVLEATVDGVGAE